MHDSSVTPERKKMRALRFERFGAPSVLQVRQIDRPVPRPGEVLIEVRAAAINPSDVKNVEGMMPDTTLPRTPGRDFAGVIVEGPADQNGAEVWGTGGDLGFTRDGTHAEYLLVPETAVRPKPRSLSMEQAAAAGLSYLTAWIGLIETARLASGETVLIIGGVGAVGRAVAQIARWKGARVIATIRSEAEGDPEWRKSVDMVVDLEKHDLAQAVLEATRGKGVEVVFNAVGGPTFEPGVKALGARGRLVCISTTGERRVGFDLLDFYRRELRFLGVNTLPLNAIDSARLLQQLVPGFEAGALRVHAPQTYPLDEAVAAYESVRQGAASKITLTMRA